MANGCPLWTSCHALAWSRLLGLDEHPGAWPIGSGAIFRRLLSKNLLSVARQEATRARGVDQLCGDLEFGMEGQTHRARSL